MSVGEWIEDHVDRPQHEVDRAVAGTLKTKVPKGKQKLITELETGLPQLAADQAIATLLESLASSKEK